MFPLERVNIMCGIFGVWGHPEAANLAYLGLHALQHRGQESAGIASTDGRRLAVHRTLGLVQSGFSPADLGGLPGRAAIGHVRYSTAGGSSVRNMQPLAVDYQLGALAVAHNGNLTNHEELRRELEARGSIFQTTSDTECIIHLIAQSDRPDLPSRIADALAQVRGAYSLLFLAGDVLVAVRDPRGFRPLVLGKMPAAPGAPPVFCISSETTSFDLIGAERVRDVAPGEMVIVDERGLRSRRLFEPAAAVEERRMCLFEYVYFSRPDSVVDGASVYEVRKQCGRRLIEEHPVPGAGPADTIVVPVPDSGVPAAIGLANHAGLPFEMGLIRSHYVGRTFIEPQQSIRHFGVRLKLNPNAAALAGKKVIVVDDSIVRGTTSRKLVRMLRASGARQVHVRISSPPTTSPCFYGIDTPTRGELIASDHSVEQIRAYLGADSLGYLSLANLAAAVNAAAGAPITGTPDARFCHACFTGDYPLPIDEAPTHRRLHVVATGPH